MGKHIAFILSVFISFQSFALVSDYDYGGMVKELKSCRETLEGCTTEQELEIAKYNGLMLSPYDLDNYLFEDTKNPIYIPLALNNNELLLLAAATSLGVVAFKNDQEIMDVVQKHKGQKSEPIVSIGNFLGTPTPGMMIAAGSYFLGVAYKNNQLKQVGIFIVGSSLATSIIGEGVKRTFGRSRPRMDKGPYDFFTPGAKSFYSGHTTEAFTVATVISEMFKEDYPVVPWVAYGLATVTAYARMRSNAHWASDVIAGAIAGHLITKLAMNYMKGNTDDRGGLLIYPDYDRGTGTFKMNLEWRPQDIEAPMKCSKMMDGSLKIEACLSEALGKK